MYVKNVTKNSLVIEVPAKINLFLEVLNRREDGFHNINSLFQAVSLFDILDINLIEQPVCLIKPLNNKNIPINNDNLIAKAYNLLKTEFNLKQGIDVTLEKNIPIAAGLAGGSADAAGTILACNILFNLGLSKKEMAELSLQIGSDLPFFFSTGQALVTGQGEILKNSDFPIDYEMVLVNPGIPISTPSSFAALKRGLTKTKNPFTLRACRTVEEMLDQLQLCGNDFEEVHLKSFEVLQKIRGELLQLGAKLVRMSGSGPTMFGIFQGTPNLAGSIIESHDDWLDFTVGPIVLPDEYS